MNDDYLRRLVESGQIRQMRGREILTLLVLLTQSPPGMWFKIPFSQLGTMTGQHRLTISKAIGELARRGMLEHIPGHGRFQPSSFRIVSRS